MCYEALLHRYCLTYLLVLMRVLVVIHQVVIHHCPNSSIVVVLCPWRAAAALRFTELSRRCLPPAEHVMSHVWSCCRDTDTCVRCLLIVERRGNVVSGSSHLNVRRHGSTTVGAEVLNAPNECREQGTLTGVLQHTVHRGPSCLYRVSEPRSCSRQRSTLSERLPPSRVRVVVVSTSLV